MKKALVFLILLMGLAQGVAFAVFEFGSTFDQGDQNLKKYALIFAEKAETPSNPPANFIKIYAKDDGGGTTKLYTLDSDGTETELGAGGGGSGDITAVTAGDGLTGGAASGAATLNVGEGLAIDVAADAVAFDPTEITGGTTWDDGGEASVAWTFNLSGTDPVLTFSSGALALTGNISATNLSGTNTGDQTNISGNAGTATALASNPDDCGANNFAISIAANGNLTCAQPAFSDLSGSATDGQIPNSITIDLATTATTANAGDSATAFFSSGTIEHERGGLEADISAYDGLIGITGGSTYNVTGSTTQIIIFDGSGAPTVAALSGDATMSNAGVVTVANDSHSHSAATLDTDSVSADELNAGGVEAELEAVLDLADLQEKDIDSLSGGSSWGNAITKTTADLIVDAVEVDFEAGTGEGYPRLAQSTTPPSTGCDEAAEAGRLYFDTNADTDGSVFVCTGAGGWKDIDDDGGAGGSGDITDVYNCASGDCSSIAAADGDLLDFDGVTVNTTTEGIYLPTFNAGGTGDGQISWDPTNDLLYIGDGSAAITIGRSVISSSGTGSSADRYFAPGTSGLENATETNVQTFLMPFAARLANLRAKVRTAPGAGTSWIFTIRTDESVTDTMANTSITCTIADAALKCDDSSNTATVSAGKTVTVFMDRVSTASAPGMVTISFEAIGQ